MSATESDPIASTSSPAGPAPVDDRILALDAIRGFALFGILVVNILGVSGLRAFAIDETSSVEPVLRQIVETFFQGKFVSLFSILFGIGFFLQIDRLRKANIGVFPRYWRRLVILFVIGTVHTLLQPGEVLMPYALCGALLLVFYKMPWKVVLAAAILLLVLPHVQTAWMTANAMNQVTTGTSVTGSIDEGAGDAGDEPRPTTGRSSEAADETWDREVLPGRSWDPYDGPEAIRVFSKGSLADVSAYSRNFTLDRWATSWEGYLWITFPLPLMLVGLLIGRSDVLRRLDDRRRPLQLVCWGGLAAGLGLYWMVAPAFAWASAEGWNPWVGMIGNVLFVISALLLALAYGAGVFLLFHRDFIRGLLAPLGAVGRMALTNYLLQTIVTTGLFWGFGLGWYGRYGAGIVEIIAVVIFTAQAIFSIVWLRYFRYGPMEWLWRCGTYWQILPLKASPAE